MRAVDSDQVSLQKQTFDPLLSISTTGRNAVADGEVMGARKGKLADLRWKREGVLRGSKLKKGKVKVLFSTLLPKNVRGYIAVTCAGKEWITLCRAQSEQV